MDDLPEEFDLVVIGTGFPESCVAAAASRIGKTVLHIDPNDFYGDVWASFNLETFTLQMEHANNIELRNVSQKWFVPDQQDVATTSLGNAEQAAKSNQTAISKEVTVIPEKVTDKSEEVTPMSEEVTAISEEATAKSEEVTTKSEEVTSVSGEVTTISKEGTAKSEEINFTRSSLLEKSRRFSIDLCPKLLYSLGPLVKLLISSNICRYAEFRSVDRVCTFLYGEIINVPCSRSDVFNTKDINIIEKRLLMKLFEYCAGYSEDTCEEDAELYRHKTFREFLLSKRVTEKIIVCMMQAIAMCNNGTSFDEGMQRTQHFMESLGRYGNTPFLFPMYGCGEVPQCFCRLCAVFGGTYCLKRQTTDITVDADTGFVNVFVDDKKIRSRHVVASHGNIPEICLKRNMDIYGQGELINCLSRAVLITATPLGNESMNSGGGGVNLLRLLYDENEAFLIQLSHFSGTCPKGCYVFHLTTPAKTDEPEKDLQPFMAQVFNNQPAAPKLLYAAYFTITGRQSNANASTCDSGIPIFCTNAPYYELDYDKSIANAREIFGKIYGDAEFLPRAPDPDEIVIDGEDPRALSESGLPDDLREQLHELQKTEDTNISDSSVNFNSPESEQQLSESQRMEIE